MLPVCRVKVTPDNFTLQGGLTTRYPIAPDSAILHTPRSNKPIFEPLLIERTIITTKDHISLTGIEILRQSIMLHE